MKDAMAGQEGGSLWTRSTVSHDSFRRLLKGERKKEDNPITSTTKQPLVRKKKSRSA